MYYMYYTKIMVYYTKEDNMMARPTKHGGKDKRPEQFRCDEKLSNVISLVHRKKHFSSRGETIRELIKGGVSIMIDEIMEEE